MTLNMLTVDGVPGWSRKERQRKNQKKEDRLDLKLAEWTVKQHLTFTDSDLCTAVLYIHWWLLVASGWASNETASAQLEASLVMGHTIWHKEGPVHSIIINNDASAVTLKDNIIIKALVLYIFNFIYLYNYLNYLACGLCFKVIKEKFLYISLCM